jgi:predicted ATPase
MDIDGESYQYRLLIDRRRHGTSVITVIKHEELLWNNKQFYLFDGDDVTLFRIHRDTGVLQKGTSFPGDWRRSIIERIGERDDNKPVIRFRNELSNYLTVHPIPVLMSQKAMTGTPYLERYGENFADWFYHHLLDSQAIARKADAFLEEILTGYQYLSFKDFGGEKLLRAVFDGFPFEFSELSEGQRQLIFLYTLLAYMQDEKQEDKQEKTSAFFIDEPDNFVTLREINPWWDGINETFETPGKQVILISHHPTVVDRMHDKALWFSRPDGKHTIVKPYTATDGLTPSETMERGWME